MGRLTGISLFASAGIGDLALRALGVNVLVANELLPDRASLFSFNFPECEMIVGSIQETKSEIIDATVNRLGGRNLDVIFATPPCQGMSKNGRGRLLSGIRAGLKPKIDERNLLILDVIDLVLRFKPSVFVVENVPEMETTIICDRKGNYATIPEVISHNLTEYSGQWKVLEFADYGVPQRRQRLLSVFVRKNSGLETLLSVGSIFPLATHSQQPGLFQKKWVSIDSAIQHLPPLDSKNEKAATSNVPFHRVPLLDDEKYFWVSHTPKGKTAFDNQCSSCGYQENALHSTSKNEAGINRAHKHTPVRCEKCSSLLPRPWVKENGEYRIMSGFTSAYKRMRGDLPASALTTNLSYACSDQKLHPNQNRVLSLCEAFILHTISDYTYYWQRADGKKVSDKTIREVIGESIPPKGLEIILTPLVRALERQSRPVAKIWS